MAGTKGRELERKRRRARKPQLKKFRVPIGLRQENTGKVVCGKAESPASLRCRFRRPYSVPFDAGRAQHPGSKTEPFRQSTIPCRQLTMAPCVPFWREAEPVAT